MLFRDPPDHTRLRALVSRAFTPRVVEAMRPHIQEIVDTLLDRVRDAHTMDLIEDLAYPLPVTVICEMLGVPTADRDVFKQWSSDIARSLDAAILPADSEAIPRGRDARAALSEYLSSLIATRRKNPRRTAVGPDRGGGGGQQAHEGELLSTCMLLLIAGHETTVNLIGNGVLSLLQHPDQMRVLREDPALTQTAVEELLRFDAPVQRTGRLTNTDVEIGGRQIAKGSTVVAVIGAANRDPRTSPTPTVSTSPGVRTGTSPSALVSTSAWVPRWPASRARSRSARRCAACQISR